MPIIAEYLWTEADEEFEDDNLNDGNPQDTISEITFGDLTEHLGYIKVTWNGNVVYDDTEATLTPEDFYKFREEYFNKVVYKMKLEVVRFHHVVLEIEGE